MGFFVYLVGVLLVWFFGRGVACLIGFVGVFFITSISHGNSDKSFRSLTLFLLSKKCNSYLLSNVKDFGISSSTYVSNS